MLSALLLAGALGCSGSDPTTGSPATSAATAGPATTTPPAPTLAADVTYTLPTKLCAAVDDRALKEIFPIDGEPVVDAAGVCGTSRASEAMRVSLSIDVKLLPNPKLGKQLYDSARRLATSTPTDLSGVGAGAFWTGDNNKVKLFSYHGNLTLTIICEPVSSKHQLPADVPQRLGRVAAGTFARLAT
jgi:hypothetical protein